MNRLSLVANHLSRALVTCEILAADKLAIVTLNRPEKLNSLSIELFTALNATLLSLESSPDVHVIILTGAGKAFCAGADVTTFNGLTTAALAGKNPIEQWFEVLPKLKKPIIAAVNGLAFGGGLEIAMMCDIIIADKSARFGQPEVKLAVIPGAGATQRITKAVGKYRAMEIMLTGEPFSAEEAKSMGLISRVSKGQVLEEAVALGKKIAKFSLPCLCLCKKAVNVALETGLSQGLFAELQLFNQSLALNDKNEGMSAMLAKRPAKFTNT